MGVKITCDRCGELITHADTITLRILHEIFQDRDKVLLNQVIYLCERHQKELIKGVDRFIRTYMEEKKI